MLKRIDRLARNSNTFFIVAVVALAFVAWFLFFRSDGTNNPEDAVSVTESTASQSTVTTPDSDPYPSFAPQGDAPAFSEVPLVPAPGTDIVLCDEIETGYGYRTRNWGNIRLPYSDSWPTNDPGEPPTCFPLTEDTTTNEWAVAIAAAHILWIDQCAPDRIPEVAAATAGRDLRIEKHPRDCDPETIEVVCDTVSWLFDTDSQTVLIGTRCGNAQAKVFEVPMEYDPQTNKFFAVYPITGKFSVRGLTDRQLDEVLFSFAPSEAPSDYSD